MENERLQKIIESCHINFLIGSGASKPYLDTLWNIESLLTDLDKEADYKSDTYKLLETSIRWWYFNKCMRGNLKFSNPEYILSADSQTNFNSTFSVYQKFITALNIILLKRKTSLLNKQINIFTTNMDIFLDKVLDELDIEYNDGFSGKFQPLFSTDNYQKTVYKSSAQYDVSSELPLFNLFKLHGSLTWSKIYSDKIVYDSTLSALSQLNKINFEKENLVNLITVPDGDYKNFADLKDECAKLKIEDQENFLNFKSAYEKLVMINPTKEKFENTTLRLEYYEQMRMYSNILEKENTILFVSGFSFADEHIRQITTRALNSNPTLLICVFCFNEKDKENIEALFTTLKFNNLYTEYVGYSFEKMTTDIFVSLANTLDTNYYSNQSNKSYRTKTKSKEHGDDTQE